MLLYNMTVGIDKDIESEWVDWIKSEHIPAVMKTKLFIEVKMYKVLHDEDEASVSYSIQYFATTINNINWYLQTFAPELIEQHRQQFLNKHVAFQTLLEEV
jgi:hypothetical protein